MQTYEILVQDRAVKPNSRDMTLVRTSVGIDQVRVLFDNPEWLEFPITVTFGHGDDLITQAMAVTELEGSEWSAEAYVTIPWEVIDENGEIRVTFQGTDSQGRHIITAKGAPLRVEEAGDVDEGDVPSDAPTLDQYRQAYADVVSMLGRVQEAMDELDGVLTEDDIATVVKAGIVRPDGTTIVIDANGTISVANEFTLEPATTERLGGVIPDGTSVTVDPDGTIHSRGSYELPVANGTTLGGVVIGNGLSATTSGVTSIRPATGESIGGVVVGEGLSANSYGLLSLLTATASRIGGIKVGDGLSTDQTGVMSVDYFTDEEIVELTPYDDIVIDGDGIGY